MDTFSLTPAQPTIEDLSKTEKLIARIVELAMKRRSRRPTLEAWSFRIEPRVHHLLNDASKKLTATGDGAEVNMSDVVNGLLEVFLPLILAQRGLPVEHEPVQRPEVTRLLNQLATALAAPGSRYQA